jgi:intein-encoded DNA endonuclease-like protein
METKCCKKKKIHNEIINGTKVCRKCENTRDVKDFSKHINSLDGLKSVCNFCINTYSVNSTIREEIKNLYIDTKLSCRQIAKIYNISNSVVERILKRESIKTNFRKKNPVNCNLVHNYFSIIDTEEKAYFLGFLYSDGNVNIRGKNIRTTIEIAEKDAYILENFNINCKINVNNKKNTKYMCICSNDIGKDLISKGVIPNKSLILKFPEKNSIPENLIRHFIRGYFDGDGGFHIYQHKNSLSIVSYMVGTKEFLEGVINYLPCEAKLKQITQKNTYEIRINKKVDIFNFGNFLYNESDIFLIRKKDLWIKFISQYQTDKENLPIKKVVSI